MARVNNLTDFLTDVATAIKTKKSSSTAIPAANFDTEILALPSQGVYQTKDVNITTNGNYEITPDENYDAMDKLRLNVTIEGREDLDDVLDAQDEKIAELEQALENKTAGGKVKLNIYTQTTEPTDKNGIWLQTDKAFDKIYFNTDVISSEAIDTSIITASHSMSLRDSGRCCTAMVGNYIYIFGNDYTNDTYKVWKYDVINNTFSIDNPDSNSPIKLAFLTAVPVGTDIYLFGGASVAGYFNNYKYDTINHTFTQKRNLPVAGGGTNIMGIEYNGNIYLFGGGTSSSSTVYKYDVSSNTYTQLPNLSNTIGGASICNINDNVYLFSSTSNKAAMCYNLTNYTTTTLAVPSFTCNGATRCVHVGDYIYIANSTQKMCKYDINNNTYINTNISYNLGSYSYGTLYLKDDIIYIVGQNDIFRYKLVPSDFGDKSIVISQSKLLNNIVTYLFNFNDEDVVGRPVQPLNDVFYYTTENGLDNTIPTYYGDGTQWIKFKN